MGKSVLRNIKISTDELEQAEINDCGNYSMIEKCHVFLTNEVQFILGDHPGCDHWWCERGFHQTH